MNIPYLKRVTAMMLFAAAITLTACGGSSDSDTSEPAATSEESGSAPVGGMFANLSDEDVQCLEDEGITLPSGPPEDMPEGAPEGGTPPEGMPEGTTPKGMPEGTPPEGMPEGGPPEGAMPEGMEGIGDAMEACGIEQPAPPSGDAPPVEEGAS